MAYAAACKAVYPGSIPGVASSVADQAVLVRANLIRSLGCRPVPPDKIWGEFNVTRCWVTVPVPANCGECTGVSARGSIMGGRRHCRVALVVVLASVAAACGSGESSSTDGSTRTKNAALGVAPEPAACATGVIGPNGGRVLGVSGANVIEGALRAEPIGVADAVASQKAAIDFAAAYSLDGRGGWSIPLVEVYQALKDEIFRTYGKNDYWSSTSWGPGAPILMTYSGTVSLKSAYMTSVLALPIIQTAAASAACTVIPTTTTSSTTTTSTTSTSTTTTSTIATPSTVAMSATSCTADSDCRVGNTGPGGGLVVAIYEDRNSEAVSDVFLEMAPRGWDGPQDPMIGMPASVRAKVAAYKGGGLSDWRAPLETEWSRICRAPVMPPYVDTATCITGLGLGGVDYGNNQNFVYWTHEKATLPYAESKNLRFVRVDTGGSDNSDLTPRLRPVRTWKRQRASLTTEPATLPPTTTTLAPVTAWSLGSSALCADLSRCEVGQRGPGGGLIISKESSGREVAYVQMAPDGWASRTAVRDPLLDAASAIKAVREYPSSDGSAWALPDVRTIEMICRIAAGRAPGSGGACVDNGRIANAFGSGRSTPNKETYWVGSGGSVSGTTDFVTGKNIGEVTGSAYVRPVRVLRWVPATTTTTTTIPLACERGGVCKIGDISPTGGLIVDFSINGANSTYTEIAPKTWRGGTTDQVLTKREAISAVSTYVNSASPGSWQLPTDRQMRAAFVFFANNPTFGPDCRADFPAWRTLSEEQYRFRFEGFEYWLSAQGRSDKFDNFQFATGTAYYDVEATMRYNARPFAERPYRGGGNASPAKWSTPKCETQVIPTTTTTTQLVSCAGRGRCNIGDIGPNKGIIIGIRRGAPGDITYTEMEIVPTSTYDCMGTAFGDSCAEGEYDEFLDDRGRDGTFDYYPTVDELKLVASRSEIKSKLRLLNGRYFSSTSREAVSLKADVNPGLNGSFKPPSVHDLAQSLEVEEVTVGVAIHVRDGLRTETQFAYFRGVNRWKCRYSCK